MEKLKAKVRKMTRKAGLTSGPSWRLKRYLMGWRNYFGFSQTVTYKGPRQLDPSPLASADLAAMEDMRPAASGLRKRDVDPQAGRKLSGSSLGPWPISRTMTLHYPSPRNGLPPKGFPPFHQPVDHLRRTAGCGPACPVV